MNAIAIFITILALIVPIIGDRPARRPGNLTPIQLISALGAWALVLADASAIAIGIRDGSPVLLCTATATVVIALILMFRQYATHVSDRETPQSLNFVVDDLKQLLGGAPRLGMASLDAVVVAGHCPGIGVDVGPRGRVVVRVRGDVAEWIEGHRHAGGTRAEVVASFVRFVVLHELAHVLNGDHRTFRFVRSVLVANLLWIAAAAAAATSLVLDREASARPLVVAASIIVLLIVQSLVARRFIAEREQLADWRAMQTLPPVDSTRLSARRGRRRGVLNPTELEKLMTDLKARAPLRGHRGLLSQLIGAVWPEGDDIHHRSEKAASEHAGSVPRPVLWAALTGMQCGFLSMSGCGGGDAWPRPLDAAAARRFYNGNAGDHDMDQRAGCHVLRAARRSRAHERAQGQSRPQAHGYRRRLLSGVRGFGTDAEPLSPALWCAIHAACSVPRRPVHCVRRGGWHVCLGIGISRRPRRRW